MQMFMDEQLQVQYTKAKSLKSSPADRNSVKEARTHLMRIIYTTLHSLTKAVLLFFISRVYTFLTEVKIK